jgi:ADP-ribose pyrophosphatase
VVSNGSSNVWNDEAVQQALEDVSPAGAEYVRRAFAAAAMAPPRAAVLAELVEEVASWRGCHSIEDASGLLCMAQTRALARVRGRTEAPGPKLRRNRGSSDTESVGIERPFVGFFALERHAIRHRRFDGEMTPRLDRLVFASGDAVTLLPYDPQKDRVLIIEQFRAGPYARHDRLPWCLEAIAGRCEVDEDPEATARREAREEAGLEIGRMERILGYYTSPAVAAEHITAFVGEADLGGEHGLHGLETEQEDIRAFAVPRAEAAAAVASGEANNAPLALSLLWLELNAERLKREWSA